MKRNAKYILYVFASICLGACKVPYNPPAITNPNSYLVVEGLINISDSTLVKLSRSVNIASVTSSKPELRALITIESNNGNTYALNEQGKGSYAAPNFSLSSANQYRLRIKTSNGEQYLSDFDETKVSPPIDSVTFTTTTDLKIYANTHDATNATRYYRWDYNEAWEFHASYNAQYISDGFVITRRTPAQQIYQCFTSDTSHLISLGTSTGLAQDVIKQGLITTILADAEKIGFKYTIEVKQYALTKDAYAYWTLLQKNTEQLGSIFDAQPSASIGNIHCITNPAEPVIGYISAGTITSQRIFITKSQLPNWVTTPFYPQCYDQGLEVYATRPLPNYDYPWQNEYFNYKQPEFVGFLFLLIPVSYISGDPDHPFAWLGVIPICADCTTRGKVTPPPYWK